MNSSDIEAVEDKDGGNIVVTEEFEVNIDVSLESKGQASEGSEEWFVAASEEVREVK